MAGVLEFVDVRPHLGLPAEIMDGTCPAGGTSGVQLFGEETGPGGLWLQLDEDAAYFLNIVFFPDHMFVTQQVTKPQLNGFVLGFRAGVEWTIFGP